MADALGRSFAERRDAAVREATKRELDDLRGRLRDAEVLLADLPSHREFEREAQRLELLLSRRTTDLEQAFAELLEMRDEARLCRRQLDAARDEVNHLGQVLAQIQQSPSWRVTAPLRKLKRWLVK
jgi:chromosome segregation ATPase